MGFKVLDSKEDEDVFFSLEEDDGDINILCHIGDESNYLVVINEDGTLYLPTLGTKFAKKFSVTPSGKIKVCD